MKFTFKLLIIAMLFSFVSAKADNPTYPQAYDLNNDYSLTSWAAAAGAGNFPTGMRFHYNQNQEPTLENSNSYYDYNSAYNLSGATRVLGRDDYGFAFVNTNGITQGTGSGLNDTTSRRMGIAVLALNTTGRTIIKLNWTGRTLASGLITANYRVNAIALQYRVGESSNWTTLQDASNQPVIYYSDNTKAITLTNASTYTSQTFENIQLPADAEDQPLVQIRWVYYCASGSGTRPTLGVDDISINSLSASGVPKKLGIVDISPAKVLNGLPFSITVNTLGDDNSRKNVISNTQINVSLVNGNGTLSPIANLTKTLAAGDNSIVFENMVFDNIGTKTIRIQTISGMALTSVDYIINVLQSPYILNFEGIYSKGHAGSRLPVFYVTANNANTDLNTDFNSDVTILIKNTTTGQIFNNTVTALNGIAKFENLYFDQAGTYTVQANSAGVIYSNNTQFSINPAPVFTEVKIPEYMIGYAGSGDGFNWRVPAYSLIKIENLHPNTEYRYNTRGIAATNITGPENGVGACLYFDEVRDSAYYSSKYGATNKDTMSAPLPFSSFVTDESGAKNLWINMVANTYVAVFANNLPINWILNLGSERGNVVARYRTTKTTKTLNFGTSTINKATGIADQKSGLQSGHYVGLYTGTADNEKLLSIAYVQDDGTDLSDYNRNITPWKPFDPSGPEYYKNLDHVNGSWATIIPNKILDAEGLEISAGITKIEEYDANGNIVRTWTDEDGIWAGVNTNNANGGMYNPINMFETPNIGDIHFMNSSMTNLCNTMPVMIHCQTYGVETVNIEYTENNGVSWEIIASQVPVVDSEVQFEWNFENFKSYDKPVKMRVICNDHSYIFAMTDEFTVYNQPVVNKISGGGQFCKDEQVVLLCNATGSEITYQWRKDGVNIEGETKTTLVIPSAQFDDSGIYTCLLVGNNICDVIESNDVLVYIEANTRIIQQPKNTYAKLGAKAIFEVKAHTIGVAPDFMAIYQWYKGSEPLSDINGKYSGSNTSMLVINNVANGDESNNYWVRVSGLCSAAQSETASLGIANIEITSLTPDQTICENTALSLNVTATSGDNSVFTFQWLKDGKVIKSANSQSYYIANTKISDAGIYTIKISDEAKGFFVISDEINVIINSIPKVITQPQAQYNVSQGTIINISVAAEANIPTQYRWYKDNTLIDGETLNTIEIAVISSMQEGNYYCELYNDCGTVQSAVSNVALIPGGTMLSVNDVSKSGYVLYAPTPNPVNSSSIVKYYIPKASRVTFTLRDASGREIATIFDEIKESGNYELNIDASSLLLSSGTYFYSLQAGSLSLINKMTVVK